MTITVVDHSEIAIGYIVPDNDGGCQFSLWIEETTYSE